LLLECPGIGMDMHHDSSANLDAATVRGFGREWRTFTQEPGALSAADREAMFDSYFELFPWHLVGRHSIGADIGCGSGRWAGLVAPRVQRLHACDPSAEALAVARRNLADRHNVDFHLAAIDRLPIADAALDFAYCLGVLHHVPDTERALAGIARKLKPGAPLLVYIYYALDNRPRWYRVLWQASNGLRVAMVRLPHRLQLWLTTLIALSVYWPLARTAAVLERLGLLPSGWPLAWYRHRSLYVMRTDAFDRFCTRLEQRFTRAQIDEMLQRAGFESIVFSTREPFWCAVAVRSGT
jgi:SAM-dependent methyltransferase